MMSPSAKGLGQKEARTLSSEASKQVSLNCLWVLNSIHSLLAAPHRTSGEGQSSLVAIQVVVDLWLAELNLHFPPCLRKKAQLGLTTLEVLPWDAALWEALL